MPTVPSNSTNLNIATSVEKNIRGTTFGPSIYKFDYELIYSGLSAARDEPVESLQVERLKPSRVNNISETSCKNTPLYLRIEALSLW